jgi:putative aldouronate transport system permease protein
MLVKNGYSFWPKKIDLSAYKYLLFGSGAVLRGYAISILVTVSGTLLSLLLTILFAYPLSRKDLPGRNIFAFFIFFTMLFNGGLVPTYIMWTQMFHIKNTLWALIFPNLLMNAFNVIMMRTYFMTSVPEEVIEAARIDGSGEFRILFGIVVPMALPIIITITLLVGLGYWNDWLNGLYYINNDKYYSIQVLLTKMLENVEMVKKASSAGASSMKMPSTSIRMAVAVIGALPVLAVYPFFQKYFVKGIVIGAVKG